MMRGANLLNTDANEFIRKNSKVLAKLNLPKDEEKAVVVQMINLSEILADLYLEELNRKKEL